MTECNGKFSYKQKKELKAQSGHVCSCCDLTYYSKTIDEIESIVLQAHHINPRKLSFDDSSDNALMLCDKCHKRLHMFIDIFQLQPSVDYTFLLTVYIHFFNCSRVSRQVKSKYHYAVYANNLEDLFKMFILFISNDCSADIKNLFVAYYKSCFNNKRGLKRTSFNLEKIKNYLKIKVSKHKVLKSFNCLKSTPCTNYGKYKALAEHY